MKSKFKHIRENFPQLNRYNLDCTRVVVHIYVSFTWYNFSEIVPIYDILFAPKLSGERRLDRPYRRRLQSKPKRQH